jgi:hypothetical protein
MTLGTWLFLVGIPAEPEDSSGMEDGGQGMGTHDKEHWCVLGFQCEPDLFSKNWPTPRFVRSACW